MLNSPVDIALLFGVALLIFGPKKLPEIGKALGQGIGNFKRSMTDAQEQVKSAIKDAEVQTPPDANVPGQTNPPQTNAGQAAVEGVPPKSPISPG